LEKSRQQIEKGGGISHKEFWVESAPANAPKKRGRSG
jgi:hypothetical protein